MNEAILLLWDKISNLIDEKIGSQKYDSTFKSTVMIMVMYSEDNMKIQSLYQKS